MVSIRSVKAAASAHSAFLTPAGVFEMQLSSVACLLILLLLGSDSSEVGGIETLSDGNGDGRTGMIRNDMKGGEFEFRQSAVQFCEAECTIASAGDDDHWSEVARTTLGIGSGFDFFIKDENEGTGLEVLVTNRVGGSAFEVSDGREAAAYDSFVDLLQIFVSFG